MNFNDAIAQFTQPGDSFEYDVRLINKHGKLETVTVWAKDANKVVDIIEKDFPEASIDHIERLL